MAHRSDDDGSVLVLGIGAVAVLMTVLLVVVDVSLLALRHHEAALTADAAARAAAQGLDLARYYRVGAVGRLPLDELAARRRAQRIVTGPWNVARVEVVDDVVSVVVTAEVPLIMSGLVGHPTATVTGSGAAALYRS